MKYILACLLALAQLSFAQNDFNPSAGIVTPKDYSTVVPYENINGKIIINVEVNGKPCRFIFDTGMAITAIDKKILDATNHSTFSVLVRDQSDKTDSMLVNKLNQIRIGNVDFNEVPVLIMDFDENPVFNCFNVDGFLGSNLLAYTAFQISSTEKTITLTDNPSTLQLNKEQSSELIFPTEKERVPFIKVNFINDKDTVSGPILFDVGANHLFRLSLEHLSVFQENNVVQHIVRSKGSTSVGIFGNADEGDMFRVSIPQLEINGSVLNGIQAEVESNSQSSIGTRLFDYGIVTFDYINSMFYFKPFNAVSEINEKLFPISPTVNDGKLVVGAIWDTSLENQISVGDQIVSIDDIDYTNITMCDLVLKGVEFKDKERMTFGIKNATGEVRKITLERK